MPDSLLLIEHPLPGCALLTLNRPQAMNALSRALRADFVHAVDALAADGETRVLVLTGAGRAFCAGLDLKELGAAASGDGLGLDDDRLDAAAALERFAGPVIGAVNGAAVTGGFELALACDLLLAAPEARFADTHARVGVVPGWGLSQKLPRLIGAGRAKELSFTGNFLDAQTAAAWGLVNRVVAPDRLLPEAIEMAADMLSTEPATLRTIKALIDDGLAGTLADGLALERRRSVDAQRRTDPAALEARRHGVRARGRQQVGTDKR